MIEWWQLHHAARKSYFSYRKLYKNANIWELWKIKKTHRWDALKPAIVATNSWILCKIILQQVRNLISWDSNFCELIFTKYWKDILMQHTSRFEDEIGSSLRKESASLSSTSETSSMSSRRFSATKASILAGISEVTTFSLQMQISFEKN